MQYIYMFDLPQVKHDLIYSRIQLMYRMPHKLLNDLTRNYSEKLV